jgi:hypothetical protein
VHQRKPIESLYFATILVLTMSCGQWGQPTPGTEDGLLAGPYMGQRAPGMTPEKFLGDVLDHNFCSVFSPDGDEFYFTHYDPDTNACSIEFMTMADGVWSEPEVASFSSDFTDNDIAMSADGNRVIFRSNRPLPGQTTDEQRDSLFLWTSVRTDTGWTDAESVAFDGRTDIPGGYPSLTHDGTLYFTTKGLEDPGPKDIHRAKFTDGAFAAPENLGDTANSPYGEGDLFVSPDGSLLIVSCYDHPENIGGESLDLWVSFREADNSWTAPANLGPPINTAYGENCPTVSPDGKFLFFNRYTGEEGNDENGTYWIDARILNQFRPGGGDQAD